MIELEFGERQFSTTRTPRAHRWLRDISIILDIVRQSGGTVVASDDAAILASFLAQS